MVLILLHYGVMARHQQVVIPATGGDPVRRALLEGSITGGLWIYCASLRPLRRAMTVEIYVRILAARLRPSFARNFLPSSNRGRREDRVRAAPAVSCAVSTKKAAHEHTGQRRTPGLPCAVALRLIACSPRRTSSWLTPSLPFSSAPPDSLTPATGRQDHTSLPYAYPRRSSRRNISVHRNPSNVRDDGRRPLSGTGWPNMYP